MERVSFKEISKLAIPAILFNVVEPVIGMTDLAIIGRIPEHASESQAGVGLAAGLMSLLIWSLAQVRTAVSAIVARYYGRDQLNEIRSLIPVALGLAILLGTIAWFFTSWFYAPISDFLYDKSDPTILREAESYYKIRSIGLPLALFIACCFGIFRGFQNTVWAMIISMVGGGINLVLDLLLIHPSFLSAGMGAEGAAWASVVSQAVMALMCLGFLEWKTPFSVFFIRKKVAELRTMFSLFANMFIRTIAVSGTFIIAYRFANKYGQDPLTAYAIGSNIWLFSSYFIDGFSNAGNAISGKLLGAGDYSRLKLLRNDLIRINLYIAIGLGVVYMAGYYFIGDLFSEDESVKEVFYTFFWIVALMQPFNSIAFTYDGIFKGLGEGIALRNTLLLGTFGLFVPILFVVDYFGGGIFSVWAAFSAWMIFRGLSLHFIFNRKYISKQIVKDSDVID